MRYFLRVEFCSLRRPADVDHYVTKLLPEGVDKFYGFFWGITSYFHLRHSPSCLYTTRVARKECIAFLFRQTVLYVIFARERAKEQTLWLYSNPFLLERSFSTRSSGIVTSS